MNKIYYIDSENVGETWIDSLHEIDDRFIIFYTKNSPKITYSQVIKLMNIDNRPEFIECHEGNNGLDFQLVSYLGYELHADKTKEMIIISNDTGFDTVVHFWKDRGMNVKRISRSDLTQLNHNKTNTPVSDKELSAKSSSVNTSVKLEDVQEHYKIINCVGANNPAHIYIALTHFYGDKKGRNIYKTLKKNEFSSPNYYWDRNTRMYEFIQLIIQHSKTSVPHNTFVISFLMNNVESNTKNMLKKKNKSFGTSGMDVHRAFKSYYTILASIKK